MSYKTQFTGPTGTNAVEAAVKLARKVTGRRTMITFTNAYHGLSLGSLALTGNQHYRGVAGSDLSNAVFMPFDGYMGEGVDTLDLFDAMLRDKSSGLDLPAGVIIETIQAEGGVNIASSSWLQRLQRLCSEFSIPLIVDDIQVGCGRTGQFLSSELFGLRPDMIVLSKSLSGLGLPMSILLVRPELDQWKPGEHTGTFRGNNLAFVTATAAVNEYWTDAQLSEEVSRKERIIESYLSEMVKDLGHEQVVFRGKGMIWAVEFRVSPEIAKRVSAEAFTRGVIVETCGGRKQSLKLLPSLTISENDLLEGLGKVSEAISITLKSFR
jgi:diaminobutyrate-2-oxoglutarate transaminase